MKFLSQKVLHELPPGFFLGFEENYEIDIPDPETRTYKKGKISVVKWCWRDLYGTRTSFFNKKTGEYVSEMI